MWEAGAGGLPVPSQAVHRETLSLTTKKRRRSRWMVGRGVAKRKKRKMGGRMERWFGTRLLPGIILGNIKYYLIPCLHKLFPKTEIEGILPNSFYETNITPMLKPKILYAKKPVNLYLW